MSTATSLPTDSNFTFAQRSEWALASAMLGVLVVLLVPLPPFLIDLLLASNFALTLLVLLVVLAAKEPLDFSVFPSILLLLTLLRLALNVATTRQILLHAHAGAIVDAFGQFVVGGNLVVGLVVFLILVVIQFVVITKGANRISEVAARFTLDALPGKQMAIDAELNNGTIDEAEARRRRHQLMREAEFHGAMDGASKFVRGDAVAGLVITAINLIGGVILGMTRGMTIGQAIQRYSILSVGDGLVSQIPALIIATAAGMLVTKGATQIGLGQEISGQLFARPRALGIGAAILCALALAPGIPKWPFLVLAGVLAWSARQLQPIPTRPAEVKKPPAATAGQPIERHAEEFLQQDRICLEIGARLIPLVDPHRGAGLLDRIAALRRELARRHGLWVPPVRIRDNLQQLEPEGYRILISGREVARGQLRPERLLAIDATGGRPPLEGEATTEPAFGMPARWISENQRSQAQMAGYMVVDPASVLITHLGEIVRRHAHELLSREDVKLLVDKVRLQAPSLVDELLPNQLNLGSLHRVLCLLLEERVPISNLTRILEALSHYAGTIKDAVELVERIRPELGRDICDRFRDAQNRLHAIVLEPRLHLELQRSLHQGHLVLEPGRLERMIVRLSELWRRAVMQGQEVALLCDTSIRRPLRQALLRALPDLGVVTYAEVPTNLTLHPVAMLRLEDLNASPTTEGGRAT
ncbi:MAG: flagellar biosynthesis protein FlhA [Gemmatales bacterium]|nr:flagellar biosynthesis protein FlhA [Gemmatales bacterium]MDW8223537.1 flagellar biosynthesis protein FlhA [Gemmatales bacterium]